MVAMRMFRGQNSRNKYFSHLWSKWSRVWSMPEAPRVHMNNVQVVDFDMCRFGHSDKGHFRMITMSPQVAPKGEQEMSEPRQRPARDTDVRIQDNSGWAAVLSQVIHAGTDDKTTRRSKQDDCKLDGNEFYDETTDEKLDKKKCAEARLEE